VDGRTVGWPLIRNGKTQRISVEGQVTVNDAHLAMRAAVDGLGIALSLEALAEPFLRSGQLVRVLQDCTPSFEGFFVYYPGHRQVPTSLRAFVDTIRAARGSARVRGSLKNPFASE
jgi:DNA-binding transcriptional LysR family regulator